MEHQRARRDPTAPKKCEKCTETPRRNHGNNSSASHELPGRGEGGKEAARALPFRAGGDLNEECGAALLTKHPRFLCTGRGCACSQTEVSVYSRINPAGTGSRTGPSDKS